MESVGFPALMLNLAAPISCATVTHTYYFHFGLDISPVLSLLTIIIKFPAASCGVSKRAWSEARLGEFAPGR